MASGIDMVATKAECERNGCHNAPVVTVWASEPDNGTSVRKEMCLECVQEFMAFAQAKHDKKLAAWRASQASGPSMN